MFQVGVGIVTVVQYRKAVLFGQVSHVIVVGRFVRGLPGRGIDRVKHADQKINGDNDDQD